jgi:hypothetical protein
MEHMQASELRDVLSIVPCPPPQPSFRVEGSEHCASLYNTKVRDLLTYHPLFYSPKPSGSPPSLSAVILLFCCLVVFSYHMLLCCLVVFSYLSLHALSHETHGYLHPSMYPKHETRDTRHQTLNTKHSPSVWRLVTGTTWPSPKA